MKLDFKEIGGPVYSDRSRGEETRKKFKLQKVDVNDDVIVEVLIPDQTYAITSSFFLGLFGESISNLKSKEKFLEKYKFKSPDRFTEALDAYIERGLRESRPILT